MFDCVEPFLYQPLVRQLTYSVEFSDELMALGELLGLWRLVGARLCWPGCGRLQGRFNKGFQAVWWLGLCSRLFLLRRVRNFTLCDNCALGGEGDFEFCL